MAPVHPQKDEAAYHVETGHNGHEGRTHVGYPPDPEHDDQQHKAGEDGSYPPAGDAIALPEEHGDRIGLHGIANAESGDSSEYREDDRQPFGVQPALEREHRTTEHAPILGLSPIFDGQKAFGVFCRDAENACNPAP